MICPTVSCIHSSSVHLSNAASFYSRIKWKATKLAADGSSRNLGLHRLSPAGDLHLGTPAWCTSLHGCIIPPTQSDLNMDRRTFLSHSGQLLVAAGLAPNMFSENRMLESN